MQKSSINLGLINFTNCLPINYSILKQNSSLINTIEGSPAEINGLMSQKLVDIAPISSVEYLLNQDNYELIDSICISSDGEVGSVILFSNYEFKNLSGKKIGLPCTSATSIALLKILLKEANIDINFINFQTHKYELTLQEQLNKQFDAVLHIGDPALINNTKYSKDYYTYDLGKLWKELTGYPMVFGSWVVRKDWKLLNQDNYTLICELLGYAVEEGLNIYFNDVVKLASKHLNISEQIVEDYLTHKINYNFTNTQHKGLMLFESKLLSLN